MDSNNYSSVRGFTGLILFSSLVLACALSSQHANASFEEAVKALQVQDGTATLAEVSKAVEQKRNDGLITFLNALVITDRMHQSTIDNIFTAEQFDTLTQLLDKAVENGSTRAQWLLHIMPKFSHKLRPAWKKWQVAAKQFRRSPSSTFPSATIEWTELKLAELEDIAAQGSPDAAAELYEFYGVRGTYSGMFYSHTKAKKWMQIAAELGHPHRALPLGFKKLHWVSDRFHSHSECLEKSAFEPVCFEMNRAEGIYWLKQAFKYIDRYPIGYAGPIHEMALLEQAGALTGEPRPKEAFLWVLYGLNRVTDSSGSLTGERSFIHILKKMRENGELQKVAPKLAEVWDDEAKRNLLLRPSRLPELPSIISQIRALPAHGELPVVSFILDDKNGLAFDVYESGKVTVAFLFNGIRRPDEEQLIRLSPAELKEFVSKVSQLRLEKWPSSKPYWGGEGQCMAWGECKSDNYQITVRLKNAERTVLFSQPKKVPDIKDSRQPQIDLVYSLIEQYLVPPYFASLFMN